MAAFYVVLNHSVESIYRWDLDDVFSMPIRAKIFSFACFTLGRSGVPIFLLLSGYLLLARKYDGKKVFYFYKSHLLSLLLTWEIWIFIYNLFLMWYNAKPFDLSMYIRNAFFLQRVELSHTWYVPMIIGMYLFLPYVANILCTIPSKILFVFMIIMYGYLYIVPSINLFRVAESMPQFTSQLDLSYSGQVYGFYLLLGYCIKRWEININKFLQKPLVILSIIGLLCGSYIWTIYAQIVLYVKQYRYMVWYNYFLMPFIGLAWFLLFKNMKLERLKNLVTQIAVCSFGIYLLHRPIQMVIVRWWIGKIGDKSTEVMVNAMGTYFLTFCIVWLLCRIPYCGRNLFMYKEKTH